MPKAWTADQKVILGLYAKDLSEVNDGTDLIINTLSQDWVPYQEQSGLQVPRYLAGLDEETDEHLHRTSVIISEWTSKFVHITIRGGDRAIGGIRSIYEAARLQTAIRRFKAHPGDVFGYSHIAFYGRVYDELAPLSYRVGFPQTRTAIDELIEDEAINRAFQSSLDWRLYTRARTNSTLDQAMEYSRAASSEAASKMIRFALDHKVLREALKRRGSDFAGAAEIVNEYASGPAAREAMLGYLAVRSTGQPPRSRYRARYTSRVSNEEVRKVREQGRKRREQEEEAEERKRQQEWEEKQRRWQEEQKQWWQDYEARFGYSQYTGSDSDDPLTRALRHVPYSHQKTLLTFGRPELQRVIDEVKRMREADPDLTARNIYLHFHALTQQPKPAPELLTTVQILGLFLNGDFSKTSVLPF